MKRAIALAAIALAGMGATRAHASGAHQAANARPCIVLDHKSGPVVIMCRPGAVPYAPW